MAKLKDASLKEFLNKLGSDAPTPGGGGVAALSSALSGSALSMVYNLTIGKKLYNELSDEIKREVNMKLEDTKKFYEESLEFIEKDEKAFLSVMEAFKMPKENINQKYLRKEAIEKSLYNAMLVPLELLRKSIKFYDNITFAIKYGNKNLITDTGIAAIMLHSAIEAAILNVKINLKSLKNESLRQKTLYEINEIIKNSKNKKDEIIGQIDLIIK